MAKKCIVCGEEAMYAIKGTSDYYCEECAQENFSDVALLVKVEELATKLKKKLDEIETKIPHTDEELLETDTN